MQRVRRRIGDKRVLALVKAFLKSGVLTEDDELRETNTGAPQGGILSPLLSNVALSILDDYFAEAWRAMGDSHQREQRRRKGLANYRLARFADDWVAMVAGTRADAEHVSAEVAAVLLPMGLRLSEEKTRIVHIDQGFDFLGMHIQRHKQRGSTKHFVYTYPSRTALAAVKAKVRDATRRSTNQTLATLLHRLNFVLRGWTNYHRHGAAAKTFAYISAFTWRRVWCWLSHKYSKTGMGVLRRHHTRNWWPEQDGVRLFKPTTVPITRYRYRGAAIPSPWVTMTKAMT
jgi:RNA-directed DNA polymerase